MKEAKRRVLRVLNQSDVVIEVVDARFPQRSQKLARWVHRRGKPLILLINKVDLVPPSDARKLARRGLLFSAKTRRGKRALISELERIAGEREIRVGLVGKPNVGKSSVINALRGKKVARRSPTPGYTKGEQWIRLSPRVLLIDSPGVITWREPEEELILKDALDVDRASDPELVAMKLLERRPELLEKLGLDPDAPLEDYARRTGKLMKGGEPNTKEAAKMLVRRWQRGEI